jgi:mannose-6-phosphate isomerase-like protein (cupin superfamily)
MIVGTPDTVPLEHSEAYHSGKGPYSRRTLLQDVRGSAFKYVRDITIPPGTVIGEHPHSGDDEIYFVISGTGIMLVDGEERVLGPGSAVLTISGSAHGIHNEGADPLRIFVACARNAVAGGVSGG